MSYSPFNARKLMGVASMLVAGGLMTAGVGWSQTPTSATAASSARTAGKLSHADTSFLKDAAHAGHTEVEGSKLAVDKAVSPQVKAFAKQMVDDHTKAGNELAALAKTKGVDLPTDPSVVQKGKLKILEARKGTSFDSHYASSIGVEAHEDTVKLFQKAADKADDADIKAFAAKTLPTLTHHLQMARDMNAAAQAADGKKP